MKVDIHMHCRILVSLPHSYVFPHLAKESLMISKASGYSDSAREKVTRASLKSAVERSLTATNFVIIDSMNYIKVVFKSVEQQLINSLKSVEIYTTLSDMYPPTLLHFILGIPLRAILYRSNSQNSNLRRAC